MSRLEELRQELDKTARELKGAQVAGRYDWAAHLEHKAQALAAAIREEEAHAAV